jgi:hypothetical protein
LIHLERLPRSGALLRMALTRDAERKSGRLEQRAPVSLEKRKAGRGMR